MNITFLGAAREVTGACFLLEGAGCKILVDCGMFQGSGEVQKLNARPFDFSSPDIDFLILTHAHIDHSGRIPKLVKEGFRGKIFCTSATADLLEIMLKDSAHIQEMEAEWRSRKNMRAGRPPVEPLYTAKDAEESLKYIYSVLYGQSVKLNDRITVKFRDAGHILGSASVEMWIRENGKVFKIVFSGDVGNRDMPILRDPEVIEEADYLVLESTYGDRIHPDFKINVKEMISIINSTVEKGGTVIIPSFAVGRTQEIIYELNKYYDHYEKTEVDKFLSVPVYVDSPMAVSVTGVYRNHSECFDEETKNYIFQGDNPLDFPNLRLIRSVEESKLLNEDRSSKIIISASGMCDAGRIKHHLKHNLWRKENSIIFVGYQAKGTLGRIIKDGAESVKIFGEQIKVNAQVYSLEGLSAHADQRGLLEWVSSFKKRPEKIFLVHGEDGAIRELAGLIERETGIQTVIPSLGDSYSLDGVTGRQETGSGISVFVNELRNMVRNIDELKYEFYNAMQNLEKKVLEDEDIEDSEVILNKIIQLRKDISDLNMLASEKSPRD